MTVYIVDTHALTWFISEDRRLSQKAEVILTQAESGEVEVLIPTLVLAEITHIAGRKRVQVTIDELITRLNQNNGFMIIPFDFAVFRCLLELPNNWDIHDRIIAATAIYYQGILLTRDDTLRNSDQLETIWE